LITLNVKLSAAKILDKFSIKKKLHAPYTPVDEVAQKKQTNKHAQEKEKKRRGPNNCRASRAKGP